MSVSTKPAFSPTQRIFVTTHKACVDRTFLLTNFNFHFLPQTLCYSFQFQNIQNSSGKYQHSSQKIKTERDKIEIRLENNKKSSIIKCNWRGAWASVFTRIPGSECKKMQPSASSPTETLFRLLPPLHSQVWLQHACFSRVVKGWTCFNFHVIGPL